MSTENKLSKATSISVREVLQRNTEPTSNPYYWNYSSDEKPELSFLDAITNIANTIHRKSMRGPANIIVTPSTLNHFIENNKIQFQLNEKQDLLKQQDFQKEIPFEDAVFKGVIHNRFFLFMSEEITDKVLVALQGEGLQYTISNTKNSQSIEIDVTTAPDDHPYKIGDIEWWGFVNIV